ncbi:sensor histidine kinase [Chamaesiphon minutus]|uniref:histidine kinase n=1 Tax=Chamaesiphon minutus (strain ATCC 27169 / PCC 6605) TaxID=1173020 RepID=K9UCF5_CHAP6|nr:ATP-binding protein [Chamaesiphon minutus]AFY92131.1 PAS domain S-box [Chamaesiphon minutus PCC 6605]
MNGYWAKIQNWWRQIPIEIRGSLAICLPLPCLFGMAIAVAILHQQTIVAQQNVDHTQEVLTKSYSSSIELVSAEAAVSSYSMVKDKTFLEPYELAAKNITPTLDRVEQLVKDRPQQAAQASRSHQIARLQMQQLAASIQQIESANSDNPQLVIGSLRQSRQLMDRFRQEIGNFEAEEARLLNIRTQWLQDRQQLSFEAVWVGIVLGLVGATISIRSLRRLATEMYSYDLSLRHSRNTIETVVTNIVDGVMTINNRGQIQTFNQSAVEMFGYSPDEVIGRNWQELLNCEAEDTQKLLFYEPSLVASAKPSDRVWQAMGQRKNGECFPIEVSINSIAAENDWIAIVRDITEQHQVAAKLHAKAVEMSALNHALNTTNNSLLQSNRELDQFVYVTAHDLKAPLRAIASLSEWVEEELDKCISPGTRSQMQLIRRRVYRMQSLLDSLLAYSRAGRTQNPVVNVDVNRLLEKILRGLNPPATFTIDIANLMPTFATRTQPLEQVFFHLIDNAIRHHPTQMGVVAISAIDLGDRYEFAIADNGEGIEPQYHQKIYQIFQTLKPRDLEENIGAGLAIVKKIVTAEGGTIRLESEPGNGSTFRFTWLKHPIPPC